MHFYMKLKVLLVTKFKVYPANLNLFKVSNRKIRKRCQLCLNLTIKTPERRHCGLSGVFIVNSIHNLHLSLMFLLLTLNN